ncbi:flagellar motor switch protein FliG [Roseicitreum antarcticum]|nr:FliG C-terminal domain-containing protein [Roseicitreum antarcticum]
MATMADGVGEMGMLLSPAGNNGGMLTAGRSQELALPSHGHTMHRSSAQQDYGPAARGAQLSAGTLTGRQKAAIIVRLLISEGAQLPLTDLPEDLQSALTQQMGQMRLVDRNTLSSVVDEFLETLDQVGLSFPDGIDGALSMLDGHISASAANRLRRMSWNSASFDPWEQIANTDLADLTPLVEAESTEIGSVIVSKLQVAKAAALLGSLPGDKARRLACAMSSTAETSPDVVRRIGISLLQQLGMRPVSAFDKPATARMGAILNASAAELRDSLLKTLEETDAAFAQGVRRAIFTFADIPSRLLAREVPRVIRDVEQGVAIRAFKYAFANPSTPLETSAEFLLANMPQRMAGTIREEIETLAMVRAKDGEAAMSEIVDTIRGLADAGQIALISQEEE